MESAMEKEHARVVARASAVGKAGEMTIGLKEMTDSIIDRLSEDGYKLLQGKRLGPHNTPPRYLYTVTWSACLDDQ